MIVINHSGVEIKVGTNGKIFWMSHWERTTELKNDGIIYWTWPSKRAEEPDFFPTENALALS